MEIDARSFVKDHMGNWRQTLVGSQTTILKVIKLIDKSSFEIALVVDDNLKLLGTVTDGDIRRGILRGIAADSPVELIMNKDPFVAFIEDSIETIIEKMKPRVHQFVPIKDGQGKVVNLEVITPPHHQAKKDNWVVLMAGGLGSRLQPLTDECPKPLLKLENKPLLENIIENFIKYGFRKFFISVHYKAEMIEKYFGTGGRWGVEINYIHEERQMGTAGSLSLLPAEPSFPIVVMNCDLLTKINFNHLLDFHTEQHSMATMCVREYDFQVPYGIVNLKDFQITGIDEKPIQRFFVNAGIYILNPLVLRHIEKEAHLDMPNFFNRLIEKKIRTSAFPVREYWLDIGCRNDFERAQGEYLNNFK